MDNWDNIDEQLKHALGDLELQPGLQSFDRVMQKLEEKKRRRFIIFFWSGLGVLLTGLAVWLLPALNNAPEMVAASKPNHANKNNVEHKIPVTAKTVIGENKTAYKNNALQNILEQKQATNSHVDPGLSSTLQHLTRHKHVNTVITGATKQAAVLPSQPLIQSRQETTSAAPNDEAIAIDEPNVDGAIELTPRFTALPNSTEPALIEQSLYFPEPAEEIKKQKALRFLFGVYASPRFNSALLSTAVHAVPPIVNTSNPTAQSAQGLLASKKKDNQFNFSYAYGLKFGMQVRQYEIFAGFGMQVFRQRETLGSISSNTYLYDPANAPGVYHNSFRYLAYSLEASRMLQFGRFTTLRPGIALCAGQAITSKYIDAANALFVKGKSLLSPWLYTVTLKTGFAQDLGQRLQLRFSPGIFCALNSQYAKDYMVKQRPYGLELEAALYFKLFKP